MCGNPVTSSCQRFLLHMAKQLNLQFYINEHLMLIHHSNIPVCPVFLDLCNWVPFFFKATNKVIIHQFFILPLTNTSEITTTYGELGLWYDTYIKHKQVATTKHWCRRDFTIINKPHSTAGHSDSYRLLSVRIQACQVTRIERVTPTI